MRRKRSNEKVPAFLTLVLLSLGPSERWGAPPQGAQQLIYTSTELTIDGDISDWPRGPDATGK